MSRWLPVALAAFWLVVFAALVAVDAQAQQAAPCGASSACYKCQHEAYEKYKTVNCWSSDRSNDEQIKCSSDMSQWLNDNRLACARKFASSTGDGKSGTGIWVMGESTAQANTRCLAKFTCQPSETMIRSASSKLEVTAPQTVWGVCSAGGGDISGCNHCLASPPAETCRWSLK